MSSDSVEVINIGATVYEIIPINANELYLVQAKSTPSNNNANSAKLSNRDQVKEFKLVLYDIKAMKINRKVYDMTRCVDCIAQLQIPLTRGESKSTNKSTQTVILAASKNSIIAWSHLGLNILMRVPCDSVAGSVTCLSVSRQSDLLVTGHSHGEMLLWHNPVDIFHTGAAPICTRMHWHAHGVTSLAFSYDGLYVHSGGDEGVLVTWKTSNGTHSFLPRLGNAISCIVSGEDGLLVSTTDNSVCIVDPASMKTKWSLRQFYAPYSQQLSEKSHRHADPKYTFKLAVEPRTGLIATNGYPGGLQMTDVAVISKDATEIHQALFAHTHSITDYSRISSKEVSTRMYVPCVSLFKFYRTVARENVLCTVDTRRGEGTDVDASLKFWLWHAISHTYRLTAQVDRPHSASRITALDVGMDMNKPTGSAVLCVTSSVDGCVKVWSGDFTFGKQTNNKNDSDESVDPAGDISGPSVDKKMTTGMYWVCSYSFTYRDTVCSSVYLSKDSTILCLAHGSLVSIWDPATLSLRASVVASTPQHSVSSMHMIKQASPTDHLKGGESLFLVLTTKRNICVYDLLTLRHMWTLQRGRVTSICVATDEQESLKVTVGSVTKQAWIAVCVEETIESPVPAANTTESSFKILLLGPDSATPILVFPVFDEISSITFLSPREHSQGELT